jgi:hypothetical protein
MFDQLFHYPRVLARHQNAPMLIEREQFLQHCAAQGMARTTSTSLATELSVVVRSDWRSLVMAYLLGISKLSLPPSGGLDISVGEVAAKGCDGRVTAFCRWRGTGWDSCVVCKSVSRSHLRAPSGLSRSPLICRGSGVCPPLRFMTVAGIRRSSANG